jgi:hypothetical protein
VRGRRRILLAFGALVVVACYAYRVDESQVKTIASSDLDCDPTFLKVETFSSAKDHVASYTVRGCGRQHDYECTEDPNGRVTCKTWRPGSGSGTASESDGGDVGPAVAGAAVAAGACACSNLFSHSSDPAPATTSTSNSMPTDPVRSQ